MRPRVKLTDEPVDTHRRAFAHRVRAIRSRPPGTAFNGVFLHSVLENIPNMIFIKDAEDLRFVMFNRAGETLLGYPREQLLGKSDYDFFSADQADFFTANDRAVLASGKLLDIPEEPIQTASGLRYLHTKKIPILDRAGRPRYLLGISEDITERRRAMEQEKRLLREQAALADANIALQRRDEFISVVSHELRTPLTVLRLQLQLSGRLLAKPDAANAATVEHFARSNGVSRRQVDRLCRLVDDLLEGSRSTDVAFRCVPHAVELAKLVGRVLESFHDQLVISGSGLKFHTDAPLHGCVDASRIEQVVANLVSNALKYGAGKPIQVSLRRHDEWVELRVRDQGIGIAPEMQRRIFERFERAVPITSYSGLGLGLYIARQIVLQHGGTLDVMSEIDRGSEFRMILPLRSA